MCDDLMVLDPDSVAQLRELGEDPKIGDLAIEVVKVYLETTSDRLEEVRQAVARGDQRTASEHAFSIRGSARTVGTYRVAALADQVFEAAWAGGGATPDQVVALAAALEQGHAALRLEFGLTG